MPRHTFVTAIRRFWQKPKRSLQPSISAPIAVHVTTEQTRVHLQPETDVNANVIWNLPSPQSTSQPPPYSNDPLPDYCPRYPIADHRRAFIELDSSNVHDDLWIIHDEPLDIHGRQIQLYLNRYITVGTECSARVIGYGTPRNGYIWITVERTDNRRLHAMLLSERWVERSLQDIIIRREASGEELVFEA
jgi:hypothetical protein